MKFSTHCLLTCLACLILAAFAGQAPAVIIFEDDFNTAGNLETGSTWQYVSGPSVAPASNGTELIIDAGTNGGFAAQSQTSFTVPDSTAGQFLQLDFKYRDTSGNGVGDFSMRLADMTTGNHNVNLTLGHQNRPTNSSFGDYWLRAQAAGGGHMPGATAQTLPLAGGSTTATEWVRLTVENTSPTASEIKLLTSSDGSSYSVIDSFTDAGSFSDTMNVAFTADPGYPSGNDTQIALDFVTLQTIPEPASGMLLALGAVALLLGRKRRRG